MVKNSVGVRKGIDFLRVYTGLNWKIQMLTLLTPSLCLSLNGFWYVDSITVPVLVYLMMVTRICTGLLVRRQRG